MLGINRKHSLATLAVTLGVLVAAGPASAAKNEVSIESIEIAAPRFLPEVNDEVLLLRGGSPHH